jgi:hypothetical protein
LKASHKYFRRRAEAFHLRRMKWKLSKSCELILKEIYLSRNTNVSNENAVNPNIILFQISHPNVSVKDLKSFITEETYFILRKQQLILSSLRE